MEPHGRASRNALIRDAESPQGRRPITPAQSRLPTSLPTQETHGAFAVWLSACLQVIRQHTFLPGLTSSSYLGPICSYLVLRVESTKISGLYLYSLFWSANARKHSSLAYQGLRRYALSSVTPQKLRFFREKTIADPNLCPGAGISSLTLNGQNSKPCFPGSGS